VPPAATTISATTAAAASAKNKGRPGGGGAGGGGGGGGAGGGGAGGAGAPSSSKINPVVYDFFLKGGVVMDRSEQRPNPGSEWLSAVAWDNVTEMDKLEAFSGIA
jgi:hypothetical protein